MSIDLLSSKIYRSCIIRIFNNRNWFYFVKWAVICQVVYKERWNWMAYVFSIFLFRWLLLLLNILARIPDMYVNRVRIFSIHFNTFKFFSRFPKLNRNFFKDLVQFLLLIAGIIFVTSIKLANFSNSNLKICIRHFLPLCSFFKALNCIQKKEKWRKENNVYIAMPWPILWLRLFFFTQ